MKNLRGLWLDSSERWCYLLSVEFVVERLTMTSSPRGQSSEKLMDILAAVILQALYVEIRVSQVPGPTSPQQGGCLPPKKRARGEF